MGRIGLSNGLHGLILSETRHARGNGNEFPWHDGKIANAEWAVCSECRLPSLHGPKKKSAAQMLNAGMQMDRTNMLLSVAPIQAERLALEAAPMHKGLRRRRRQPLNGRLDKTAQDAKGATRLATSQGHGRAG